MSGHRRKRGGGPSRRQTRATRSNAQTTPAVDRHSNAERRQVEWLADVALASGEAQHGILGGVHVVIVPDHYEVISAANGETMPAKTWRLFRADGRVCYLFRWPDGLAVPA